LQLTIPHHRTLVERLAALVMLANDGEGDMGYNIGLGHAAWAFGVMGMVA